MIYLNVFFFNARRDWFHGKAIRVIVVDWRYSKCRPVMIIFSISIYVVILVFMLLWAAVNVRDGTWFLKPDYFMLCSRECSECSTYISVILITLCYYAKKPSKVTSLPTQWNSSVVHKFIFLWLFTWRECLTHHKWASKQLFPSLWSPCCKWAEAERTVVCLQPPNGISVQKSQSQNNCLSLEEADWKHWLMQKHNRYAPPRAGISCFTDSKSASFWSAGTKCTSSFNLEGSALLLSERRIFTNI